MKKGGVLCEGRREAKAQQSPWEMQANTLVKGELIDFLKLEIRED